MLLLLLQRKTRITNKNKKQGRTEHYYYYCYYYYESAWKKARLGKEHPTIKQEKEDWTIRQIKTVHERKQDEIKKTKQ